MFSLQILIPCWLIHGGIPIISYPNMAILLAFEPDTDDYFAGVTDVGHKMLSTHNIRPAYLHLL